MADDKIAVLSAELEAAQDEWDNVQEVVPNFKTDDELTNAQDINCATVTEAPQESRLVSVNQVLGHFRDKDLSSEMSKVPRRSSTALAQLQDIISCISCNRLHSRLAPEHEHEMALAFAIAQCPFDDSEPLHLNVLQTLYKQFTGTRLDCPRYGSHWEQIGFQGNDPSTDLRGVGFLGLIHPLHLVTTAELLPFALRVHKLSLDENQEFPFMVMSINVTRMALHILRDGVLNEQCNAEIDFWSSFNFFYAAIVFHIYHLWKTGHKTIKDSGYVLKDTELFCRKNPKLVVENFDKHLSSAYSLDEKQLTRQNLQPRLMM